MMQQTDPRPAQSAPPPPASYVSRRDLPLKSPALAVFLSILPGLGQTYVGFYRQAFLSILVFGSTIALLSGGEVTGLEPLLGVFLAFFYFFQMIDAGRKASIYNQILERGESLDLGKDDLPEAGGSLIFGGALLVVGLLALMHNVFHVNMEWIEDWWPLVLVGTGGWLVWRARQEKAKRD